LGASDADGLVAIVISSASKALTATTSIGALKGRSLCNEAVKYARTRSFTLPDALASGTAGQTKAQKRPIAAGGGLFKGAALQQQLWRVRAARLHSN
jgi:hypothetical protein